MSTNRSIIAISVLLLAVAGCKKEETIESVPLSQIEVSTPPALPSPETQKESPRDDDGVYRIGEVRYYNAVVPQGFVPISVDENETRFYVPSMTTADIGNFIGKYFPYQKMERLTRTDVFEVYPEILAEYEGDGIIPTTDPNIIKPIPETAVQIRVFFNRQEHRYEWIYYDPVGRIPKEPTPEEEEVRRAEEEKIRQSKLDRVVPESP